MSLNERGHEIPDPTPVAVPIQWQRPPTIQEQIRMFVRREASVQAAASGYETFEEADDFDIADDPYDPRSPWEENFDPPGLDPNVAPPVAAAAASPPAPAGDPAPTA